MPFLQWHNFMIFPRYFQRTFFFVQSCVQFFKCGLNILFDSLTSTAIRGFEIYRTFVNLSSNDRNLLKPPIYWIRSKNEIFPENNSLVHVLPHLTTLKSVSIITEILIFQFFLIFPWYFHNWKSSSFFKVFQVLWEPWLIKWLFIE